MRVAPHGTRCAVWGDPIAHSKSPLLHEAAYDELGLDWTYERRRVNAGEFATAIAELDDSWRGLSLTMPLKHVALEWGAEAADRIARATGAANTAALNAPTATKAWNTDVYGLASALTESGLVTPDRPVSVRVLGSGATATSALAALSELGVTQVQLLSRRPCEVFGVASAPLTIEMLDALEPVDVTISTLPGGVQLDVSLADELARSGGALFDVAYDPWPSALAADWEALGATAISGEGMLLHQAVAQIRIWLTGDVNEPLPNEARVVARMREALARA